MLEEGEKGDRREGTLSLESDREGGRRGGPVYILMVKGEKKCRLRRENKKAGILSSCSGRKREGNSPSSTGDPIPWRNRRQEGKR